MKTTNETTNERIFKFNGSFIVITVLWFTYTSVFDKDAQKIKFSIFILVIFC